MRRDDKPRNAKQEATASDETQDELPDGEAKDVLGLENETSWSVVQVQMRDMLRRALESPALRGPPQLLSGMRQMPAAQAVATHVRGQESAMNHHTGVLTGCR